MEPEREPGEVGHRPTTPGQLKLLSSGLPFYDLQNCHMASEAEKVPKHSKLGLNQEHTGNLIIIFQIPLMLKIDVFGDVGTIGDRSENFGAGLHFLCCLAVSPFFRTLLFTTLMLRSFKGSISVFLV